MPSFVRCLLCEEIIYKDVHLDCPGFDTLQAAADKAHLKKRVLDLERALMEQTVESYYERYKSLILRIKWLEHRLEMTDEHCEDGIDTRNRSIRRLEHQVHELETKLLAERNFGVQP